MPRMMINGDAGRNTEVLAEAPGTAEFSECSSVDSVTSSENMAHNGSSSHLLLPLTSGRKKHDAKWRRKCSTTVCVAIMLTLATAIIAAGLLGFYSFWPDKTTTRRSTTSTLNMSIEDLGKLGIILGDNFMEFQSTTVCDDIGGLRINNASNEKDTGFVHFEIILIWLDSSQIYEQTRISLQVDTYLYNKDHNDGWISDGQIQLIDNNGMNWAGMTCTPEPDEPIYDEKLGMALDHYKIYCPLMTTIFRSYLCTRL